MALVFRVGLLRSFTATEKGMENVVMRAPVCLVSVYVACGGVLVCT